MVGKARPTTLTPPARAARATAGRLRHPRVPDPRRGSPSCECTSRTCPPPPVVCHVMVIVVAVETALWSHLLGNHHRFSQSHNCWTGSRYCQSGERTPTHIHTATQCAIDQSAFSVCFGSTYDSASKRLRNFWPWYRKYDSAVKYTCRHT